MMLSFTFSVDAQNVMGMNISTTKTAFNLQMKKKGYVPYKKTLGKYGYKVMFAGYPDTDFQVEYNTETDSICMVEIEFKHESIEQDKKIYLSLKEQLIAKYGKPSYDFDVYNADLDAKTRSAYEYRNVSFNNNPYLIWDFGRKNYVRMSYQTKASRKTKKPAYSSDL